MAQISTLIFGLTKKKPELGTNFARRSLIVRTMPVYGLARNYDVRESLFPILDSSVYKSYS